MPWRFLNLQDRIVEGDQRVLIAKDVDIVTARQRGRALAASLQFSSTDLTLIATTISELARNILRYAQKGEIEVRLIREILGQYNRSGIMVVARDQGPGISDIERALQVGYSTSGNLGLGLPGVRRLMDEFEIDSEPGRGTTITAKKWKR